VHVELLGYILNASQRRHVSNDNNHNIPDNVQVKFMTNLRNKFHTALPTTNITKGKKMFPRLTAYYFTVYKHVCPNDTAPLFTVYYHTLFQGLKMALVRLPPHKFARPPMITGKRCKYTSVTLFILNSVKVGLPVQNSKWRGIKTPWRSHWPTFFFRTEEKNIPVR